MHKKFYEKIVMQRDNTIAATRIIAINPAKYFFPFEFLKLIISFTSYLFLYYYTFERSKLCFLSYSYALSFFVVFLNSRKRQITKQEQEITEQFWARENKANATRRRSLDNLPYITIPEELLTPPAQASEDVLTLYETLRLLSAKKSLI